MVYANKDQVRLYNKTESEYVRQYEDIPDTKNGAHNKKRKFISTKDIR